MNRVKTVEKRTIKPNRINDDSQKLTKTYPQPDGHGDLWACKQLNQRGSARCMGICPARGGRQNAGFIGALQRGGPFAAKGMEKT